MTDGIRRIDTPVTQTATNTTNEAREVSAKIEQTVEQAKLLRDTYEPAKDSDASAFSRLTQQSPNLKSSDVPSKVDASTADLLNQQMLAARLRSPLFAEKERQTAGKDLDPFYSRSDQLTKGDMKEGVNILNSHLSELSKEKQGLLESLMEKQEKVEGAEQSTRDQTAKAVSISQNIDTQIPQQDPGKISDRSPLLPKYFYNKTKAEAENKIKEANSQIAQLKEEIQQLKDQIKALDQSIAEAEAAYQKSPTPELREKIAQMKERKDTLVDKIKQKNEQIKTLETEINQIFDGNDGQPVDQPARAVNNTGK